MTLWPAFCKPTAASMTSLSAPPMPRSGWTKTTVLPVFVMVEAWGEVKSPRGCMQCIREQSRVEPEDENRAALAALGQTLRLFLRARAGW